MQRRTFIQATLGSFLAIPAMAAMERKQFDEAADILANTVADGQIRAASICVRQGEREFTNAFGGAKSPDAMFLLASITKPISVATLMTLFDQGKFRLEDPVKKFIPEFTGDGREKITIEQLLTHTSGLPDQLSNNNELRKSHATIAEFVAGTVRAPVLFAPGTQYRYSSMGILLAAEIAQRINGVDFRQMVDFHVIKPLKLEHMSMGLGTFKFEDMLPVQMESAAPEAGGGDPSAKEWDWNSRWWREFGSPWGDAHGSASDVAKFFAEFLNADGKILKPETAKLMIQNHTAANLTPRGLGFALGSKASSPQCSEQTFAHAGATGTLAWADPATKTICVILTTLPERALRPHPSRLASDKVAELTS
jgi:CubicO group peptidase (beta-lactamase class C family)